MLLAAADAANQGWANTLGMLAAGVIIYAIWHVDRRITANREGEEDHSPTPPWARRSGVTPGETDEPDPDDTDFDTPDDTGWWGRRIRLADGSTLVRREHADEEDVDEPDDEDLGETREEMADRLVRLRCRYSDAVREIMNAFEVSESTAKRAIARAQERAAGR
jgi:hypothetical protein